MFPTTPLPGCCSGIWSQKYRSRCWHGLQSRWRPRSATALGSRWVTITSSGHSCRTTPVAQISNCMQAEVKRHCWVVLLWFNLCIYSSGFRGLYYEDFLPPTFFFRLHYLWEMFSMVSLLKTLKLRSTCWRQWNSYLSSINTTLLRKYHVEDVPWTYFSLVFLRESPCFFTTFTC